MLKINKITGFLLLALTVTFQIPSSAQDRRVMGRVTDDSGPLAGVTVIEKGTSNGVATSADGTYSIALTGQQPTLVFSFIGYTTSEIEAGARTTIDVVLEKAAIEVDELVVVGYGFQKKSHLTGSIAKFDPQGILDVPSSDLATALQGRISGVQIQNITSEVGVSPQISIRGSGTLNSGGSPLYVVDGFVMEDALQLINPADIASVEVLKDASSAAIYGSRAANGVIIITTKEGSALQPKYNLNLYTGFKDALRLHPMMSYTDYVNILTEEYNNGGASVPTNDRAAAYMESLLGTTDWQREGLRASARTTNAQLSVSGGRANMRYTLSGGVNLDDGLMKQNYVNKYNFRSRMDIELSRYVTVGSNISLVYTDSQRPVNNFVDFMRFPQWIPVRHNEITSAMTGIPVGEYAQPYHFNTGTAIYPVGPIDELTGEPTLVTANPYNSQNNNPTSVLERTSRKSQNYTVAGNVYMNIKFTPNLVFRTANSVTARYTSTDIYRAANASREGNAAEGTFTGVLRTNWTSDNTLTYMKRFGDHDLNVMGGVSVEQWKEKIVKLSGTGFPNDYIKTLNAASSFKVLDDNGNWLTGTEIIPAHNMLSFFGRINYSFRDRYLVSAVLRADGDSYFGVNNKWGYFPSVSAGWRISEEPFLKSAGAINNLKLRASYGLTGDNSLPANATKNLLYSALYSFGDGTGSTLPGLANISSLIGNPDLGWAKINEFDVGLDAGLLGDRLGLVFDYYYSITRDMLFLRPASSITGHTEYWTNQGKVRNRGFEVTLDGHILKKRDFDWNASFNLSLDRNKLLDLGGEAQIIKEGYSKERYISIVGQKAIQFYGYKTDGVWKTQEELDAGPSFATNVDAVGGLKVVDVNKDGKLDDDDMTVLGSPYPDFTWGLTNTFRYKGFDLSVLFQGVQGGQLINADGTYKDMQVRSANYNIANRWVSESHPGDGRTPTLYGMSWILTDHLVEDASYVSLRNITLGYTFPKKWLDKIHLRGLRVYATANNLWMWTASGYRGINPEYRNTSSPYDDTLIQGYQRGSFPVVRTFTFGLDINF